MSNIIKYINLIWGR